MNGGSTTHLKPAPAWWSKGAERRVASLVDTSGRATGTDGLERSPWTLVLGRSRVLAPAPAIAFPYPPERAMVAAVVAAHRIHRRDPAATLAFCTAGEAMLAGESGVRHLRAATRLISDDARWLVLLCVGQSRTSDRRFIDTDEAVNDAAGEPLWRVRELPATASRGNPFGAAALVARASTLVSVGRQLFPQLWKADGDVARGNGSLAGGRPLWRALAMSPVSEVVRSLLPLFMPLVALGSVCPAAAPGRLPLGAGHRHERRGRVLFARGRRERGPARG